MKHIKCPYCGLEDNESYEFDQEDGTVECVDCEKPNCNQVKLDNSPLCAYHWDIANC